MFDFIMYDIIGSIVFASAFAVCGCMITELFFWMFPSVEIEKERLDELKKHFLGRKVSGETELMNEIEAYLGPKFSKGYRVFDYIKDTDRSTVLLVAPAGGKMVFIIDRNTCIIKEVKICYPGGKKYE